MPERERFTQFAEGCDTCHNLFVLNNFRISISTLGRDSHDRGPEGPKTI
jgi:hypothetical protein